MVIIYNAKNNAKTILSATIDSSVTSITVADASLLPVAPFVVTIEDEILEVTAVVGNVLTVVRGHETTTPTGHLAGVEVANKWTAGMHKEIYDDLDAHLAESASKHITESGSNANGKYIKFDDGTMICYGKLDIASLAITTAIGSLFTSTAATAWTYPAAFIDSIVAVNGVVFGPGLACGIIAAYGVTDSLYEYRIVSDSAITLTGGSIILKAIGRWKI